MPTEVDVSISASFVVDTSGTASSVENDTYNPILGTYDYVSNWTTETTHTHDGTLDPISFLLSIPVTINVPANATDIDSASCDLTIAQERRGEQHLHQTHIPAAYSNLLRGNFAGPSWVHIPSIDGGYGFRLTIDGEAGKVNIQNIAHRAEDGPYFAGVIDKDFTEDDTATNIAIAGVVFDAEFVAALIRHPGEALPATLAFYVTGRGAASQTANYEFDAILAWSMALNYSGTKRQSIPTVPGQSANGSVSGHCTLNVSGTLKLQVDTSGPGDGDHTPGAGYEGAQWPFNLQTREGHYHRVAAMDGNVKYWRANKPLPAGGFDIGPTRVSNTGLASGPQMARDHRGRLYLVWSENHAEVWDAVSDDDGASWTAPVNTSPGDWPMIVIDEATGEGLLGYIEGGNIKLRYRAPGDTGFSTAVTAQDETPADISVAAKGFNVVRAREGPARWIMTCVLSGGTTPSEFWAADDVGHSWRKMT